MIVGPATVLMAFTLSPLRYEAVGLCCYVIQFEYDGRKQTAISQTPPKMFNANGPFHPTGELEPGSVIKLDVEQSGPALIMKAILVIEHREWNPFAVAAE